ncbi:MAG: VWA domain-containing protein [Acidobacteria bacterium]|nr:VWA domain-containing protein [Acidobacteriota bacterium]
MACIAPACGLQQSERGPYRGPNPLDEMLELRQPVDWQDGTAAAILVDTSGSMEEDVPGADGARTPKIVIARRAVTNLIRNFEEFAQKNPDKRVLVGIYEFSSRNDQPHCRPVVEIGPPDSGRAAAALDRMSPEGGTPIGDAMIRAKLDLDRTGMSRRHMLVVTDGKNNKGYSPGDVASVISRQPEPGRVAFYFVAFDIGADRFSRVRDAGGLVLEAANERDLNQTMDFILTGKILAEQPATPADR